MWKIKGCWGVVGVVLEDVLVAWSVGPVPTKHLISLIKSKPWHDAFWTVGTQATCQVCTHLLSPTHIQTLPFTTTTWGIKERKQILGKFSRRYALWSSKNKAGNCIWSTAEAHCQRCICCHWPLVLLFVLLVWKAHSASLRQSIPSAKVSHLWQLLERKPVFWSTTVHMNQTYVCGRTART